MGERWEWGERRQRNSFEMPLLVPGCLFSSGVRTFTFSSSQTSDPQVGDLLILKLPLLRPCPGFSHTGILAVLPLVVGTWWSFLASKSH